MNINGKEYKSNVCKYCGTALGRDNNICPWCHRAQDEGASNEIDDMLHINHSEKSGSYTGLYAEDIENEEAIRKTHKAVGCLIGAIFLIAFAPFILIILVIIINVAVNIFESASGNTEQAEPETSYYEEYSDGYYDDYSDEYSDEYSGEYSGEYEEDNGIFGDETIVWYLDDSMKNSVEDDTTSDSISYVEDNDKKYTDYTDVMTDLYTIILNGHTEIGSANIANIDKEAYENEFENIMADVIWFCSSRDIAYRSLYGNYTPEYFDLAFNEFDSLDIWKMCAVSTALSLIEEQSYSEDLLISELTDKFLFTSEEADYALEHIDVDFHQEAIEYAKYLVSSGYTKDEVREELELYQFNENQIQYALNNIS